MDTTTNSRPAATTRNLLDEFERLQRELRSHLDGWPSWDSLVDGFTPIGDIEETDDAFIVEIELAGVRRGDIEITTTDRRLVVTGERKEKERVGILRRRDRTVGEFRYEVELPAEFDADRVTAGYEDGVLSIRLPKSVADQPRRIAIG